MRTNISFTKGFRSVLKVLMWLIIVLTAILVIAILANAVKDIINLIATLLFGILALLVAFNVEYYAKKLAQNVGFSHPKWFSTACGVLAFGLTIIAVVALLVLIGYLLG